MISVSVVWFVCARGASIKKKLHGWIVEISDLLADFAPSTASKFAAHEHTQRVHDGMLRGTALHSARRAVVSRTAARTPGALLVRSCQTSSGSSAHAQPAQALPLSPIVERLLRGSHDALDEAAPQMLRTLEASDAPLIWHTHSSEP